MWFFKQVPSADLSDMGKADLLVDVRERYEYQSHHLPKAKNVPLSELDRFSTDKKVYVICASGSRSKMATRQLIKRGINAVNVKGGMARHGR